MRKINNFSECYTITTEAGVFSVITKRIKRDKNGNSRFECEVFKVDPVYSGVYTYRFQCCGNAQQAAQHAINYHIKSITEV